MIRSFYTELTKTIESPTGEAVREKKILSGKLIFRLSISIGILVFLIAWLSTETLVTAILSIPAQIWVLVISLFVVGHIISALKWRLMLRAVGINIRVSLSVRAHFAGLFANLCLPSIVGGDFIRAALVIREQKSELTAIALGSLADRLNDVLALLIIASLASFLLPSAQEIVSGEALTLLAIIILSCLVASIAVVRFLPRSILPKFLHSVFDKINRAMDSLFSNPLIALMGLTLSLLIQGGFVGLNMILANAMAMDVSILLWMFAWPMAKLVALAPISLGGIGVREVALAGILSPFGVEAGLAVAQSLSWEIVLIFTGLFSGIAVAMIPSPSTNLD